jgi:hypothetical protein
MSSPNLPAPEGDAAFVVERDRVIAQLSRHFALDEISLEELDSRIEKAYRARSMHDLTSLTADLGAMPPAGASLAAAMPQGALAEHEDHARVLAVMSSFKRLGPWVVPRNIEMLAVMSDAQLDLREARLVPGVTDIDIFAFWTSVKVIVPPGVRVVDHTTPFMADVANETLLDPTETPSPSILRIRGSVIMSELKVKTMAIGEKKKWWRG